MVGQIDAFGRTIGLQRPVLLAALPVLAAVLCWLLVLRGSEAGEAGRRSRWLLLGTRLVVVACLVVAAAGPYTVATRETTGDPQVTMLVDESASMAVQPAVADDLEREIESEGVDVTRSTVASGNRSRVGDALVGNLRENGSVLLVSDGQVTDGRSLAAAGEVARRLDATVDAVSLEPNRSERYVAVNGPSTTSVGVENRFYVSVDGVAPDGGSVELVVSVDGTVVNRTTVSAVGQGVLVTHNFSETGDHRVTARIRAGDRYVGNDVFRKTVTVVSKPRILYVSRGSYRLEGYLSELYDVSTARSVPADLDPYYAVVLQNVAAGEVGNATALQRFVLDGNGLVVVGGDSAFDNGDYASSPLGAMVPVRSGDTDARRARIVLAVDVSGSAAEGMRTQKALALNVLDQLGGQNEVGIVAFDDSAYAVADLRPLRSSRGQLRTKIRRLQAGGGTSISTGLQGAHEMLGGRPGTVILLSDGRAQRRGSIPTAGSLGDDGIRVVSVGVGKRTNPAVLQGIARASGGTYLRAGQTSRLRILFGDENRQYRGGSLTVVNGDHFVTSGVRTTASLPYSNRVSVKRGATFLVATGGGDPAVSAWRYGVGRVVAVTAYGSGGGLGGMLSEPDSLVVSKSTNWAIGDPRRKRTRIARVGDTRVGRETTVVYRAQDRPEVTNLSFAKAGDGRYEATFRPETRGYGSVAGTGYAVNYRREYAGFGQSSVLSNVVETTDGRTYAPDETEAIAETVARRARHVESVRSEWGWAALLAGLLVYLGEVAVRRIRRYRGLEAIP